MKLLLLAAFLATSLLILTDQSSAQRTCSCVRPGIVCTQEFRPVCGIKDGHRCTFRNRCFLAHCKFVHNGPCRH